MAFVKSRSDRIVGAIGESPWLWNEDEMQKLV